MIKRLCIFASGTGSNAQKIIDFFRHRSDVDVALIVSNKSTAGVLTIAKNEGIDSHVLHKKELSSEEFIQRLNDQQIDLIILAGFLKLIPKNLVKAFPNKIVNIHPALLPKYGGKGMYGMHVHRAVKANNESETGITIHYVNERYDEGKHIFQASCEVSPKDTAEIIAKKVLALEHANFAKVVDGILFA